LPTSRHEQLQLPGAPLLGWSNAIRQPWMRNLSAKSCFVQVGVGAAENEELVRSSSPISWSVIDWWFSVA